MKNTSFQYFMKISGKMFLADTLEKMSQNIFHIFPFQNNLHIFLFFRKKHLFLLRPGGLPPPPRLRTSP